MPKGGRQVLPTDSQKGLLVVKKDTTHGKRRRTVRIRDEGEESEKTSSDVEQLEKEILSLRKQLNCAAETVALQTSNLLSSITIAEAYTEANATSAKNLPANKGPTRILRWIATDSSC